MPPALVLHRGVFGAEVGTVLDTAWFMRQPIYATARRFGFQPGSGTRVRSEPFRSTLGRVKIAAC
jgi:hypothetical protein